MILNKCSVLLLVNIDDDPYWRLRLFVLLLSWLFRLLCTYVKVRVWAFPQFLSTLVFLFWLFYLLPFFLRDCLWLDPELTDLDCWSASPGRDARLHGCRVWIIGSMCHLAYGAGADDGLEFILSSLCSKCRWLRHLPGSTKESQNLYYVCIILYVNKPSYH